MADNFLPDDLPEPEEDSARDDIGQVLRSALEIAPPSVAFQAKLIENLSREYAALFGDASGQLEAETPALNLDSGEDESTAGTATAGSATAGSAPETAAAIPIRRRFRRTLKWGAAAAVLLLTAAWWTSGSRYTWASMIAAVEQSEWVQVVVKLNSKPAATGWFSDSHQVVAMQTNKRAQYDNHAAGTRFWYAANEPAIAREELKNRSRLTPEAQFVELILGALTGDQPHGLPASANIEILEESWQTGKDGNIELRIRLAAGTPAREFRLHFEIDAKTRLPLRVAREDQAADQPSLDFAYPAAGPHDIYALGVSPALPVVAASNGQLVLANKPMSTEALATGRDIAIASSKPRLPTPHPASTTPAETKPVAQPIKTPMPPAKSVDAMRQRVDALLQSHWAANSIEPVAPATDDEFLRRAYLDLTGRTPSVSEVRTFLNDARSDRRNLLLEELLRRYDHASHLAASWRTFLIPETIDPLVMQGLRDFEVWLTEHFLSNQPYDQFATDLLLAEGRAEQSGPLFFYSSLKLQPEEIARQTSRAFLGIRMDCAQCHDHFFDEKLKQRDFWGYAAFFARISQPEGKLERVSPVMRIRDSARGEVTLPGTEEIVPPKFPLDTDAPSSAAGASRRQALAAWLTSPDNPHFARATVNRVWSQLFGRGLVEPVDDMRAANAPVCPEVLDELANYFIRSGYDLRRLYLTLAQTEAYQLSSSSSQADPNRQRHFAQMSVKCFTAEQLYDCIAVATRVDALRDAGLNRLNNYSRQAFLEQFRAPPGNATEYQAGIAQALTLMNGALTNSATQLQTSGLLRSLQAPFFTDDQRIDTLFLATVSRLPTEREKAAVDECLAAAKTTEAKSAVFGDALWALLNSAEFTLIP